jgi:N utilization substance protein A
MTSKEFYKQLEIVAEERGLTLEQLLDSFKKGLINAYKRNYGNTSVRVEFKPEKNEILMFSQKIVVESLENLDPECEIIPILYTEAKKINSRAKIGDILEEPVNIKDFGRMAAAQAKQIFNQNIKTYEKENSFQYFKSMENELIRAQIIDSNETFLTLSIGQNITTLLPKKELLPNDEFGVGDSINVYVTSVEQGTKGPKVFVSRNDKHLVIRLLEQYIPEIKDGIVVKVEGNTCPRGKTYAISEMTEPKRMITSSVEVTGGNYHMVSVKTSEPIAKELIFKALDTLKGVVLSAPVKEGDTVVKDILGTGVDFVATRDVTKA